MVIYLVAAVAIMVALAGAGAEGFSLGEDHVRAADLAIALQDAKANAAFTKKLQEKYRDKEQSWAAAQSAISAGYEKRIEDAKGKTLIALNALRAGSLVLRDPGTVRTSGGSSSTETTACACGRDGAKASQLSEQSSEFLLSEAARADAIVEQLTVCQAVVTADRQ